MAKGYWIVRVDIRDMDEYMRYVAANAAPFRRFGARFLVRGGAFETPEGTSRARNAVSKQISVRVFDARATTRAATVDTDEKRTGWRGRCHSAIRLMSAPHCTSLRSSAS